MAEKLRDDGQKIDRVQVHAQPAMAVKLESAKTAFAGLKLEEDESWAAARFASLSALEASLEAQKKRMQNVGVAIGSGIGLACGAIAATWASTAMPYATIGLGVDTTLGIGFAASYLAWRYVASVFDKRIAGVKAEMDEMEDIVTGGKPKEPTGIVFKPGNVVGRGTGK